MKIASQAELCAAQVEGASKMGLPNKTEIRGKIKKTKGTIKEKIGQAVGNRNMEKGGAADRRKGSVQETFGKARRKVGDAVKDLGNTLRK